MENNEELLQAVQVFKDGIENRNHEKLKKLNFVLDADSIPTAIDLAYTDAKRTMTGIGQFEKQKKCALNAIQTKLREYFSGQAPDSETFEIKHKELCGIWCNCFKGSEIGTYGKAQKIINMSFKYLYCCNDAITKYKDYFQYCHMPLDSFTLEWFKRNVIIREWFQNTPRPRIVAGRIASWSALEDDERGYYLAKDGKEYYSYRFYLKNIREYIKAENIRHAEEPKELLSPLELEFIEWPKIQKALAAEGFLIGLEDNPPTERKEAIRKNPLIDKYTEIVKFLFENGYKNDILKLLTERGYKIVLPDETKEKVGKAE